MLNGTRTTHCVSCGTPWRSSGPKEAVTVTRCTHAILTDDLYDVLGAQIISDPTTYVDLYTVELIAGMIPHAAIGLAIIEKHHQQLSRNVSLDAISRTEGEYIKLIFLGKNSPKPKSGVF